MFQIDKGNIAPPKPILSIDMELDWQTIEWQVPFSLYYVSPDEGREWSKHVVKPELINE
jgi:hypothetical protein